MNKPIVWGR